MGGDAYPRYPNWRPLDMTKFKQDRRSVDRGPGGDER